MGGTVPSEPKFAGNREAPGLSGQGAEMRAAVGRPPGDGAARATDTARQGAQLASQRLRRAIARRCRWLHRRRPPPPIEDRSVPLDRNAVRVRVATSGLITVAGPA